MENSYGEFKLPDNINGRSLQSNVIPTVCNVRNMLLKLVAVNGDVQRLKQWEKRSYRAYLIDEIKGNIIYADSHQWREILRKHLLQQRLSDFGASVIDIYLVAYVSQTYGIGKNTFFTYINTSGISQKANSANAIWQVGKGDGVFLGIINDDGTVRDWEFMYKWLHCDDLNN
jgi:hypothetical protein